MAFAVADISSNFISREGEMQCHHDAFEKEEIENVVSHCLLCWDKRGS